jgi:hypothetical protein
LKVSTFWLLFATVFLLACRSARLQDIAEAVEQQPAPGAAQDASPAPQIEWVTNGPVVFASPKLDTNLPASGKAPPPPIRGTFHHYLPGSLNNLIWTNFIAHTNGKTTQVWSTRTHPTNWPKNPPVVEWNTNSLAWGMKGLTALSPCWEDEGSSGQAPVTALTRRHGFTRGHSMGADGITTARNGKKVWFLTTGDKIVEARVKLAMIRTYPVSSRDYTILLFARDLPASIQPLRVAAFTEVMRKYTNALGGAPWPIFKTEQEGYVSTEVPPFIVNTWKGGDSGSPNMLPMPDELIFLGGRSTSGVSPEMQKDMNELCRIEGLDPEKYQLQWLDFSLFHTY